LHCDIEVQRVNFAIRSIRQGNSCVELHKRSEGSRVSPQDGETSEVRNVVVRTRKSLDEIIVGACDCENSPCPVHPVVTLAVKLQT